MYNTEEERNAEHKVDMDSLGVDEITLGIDIVLKVLGDTQSFASETLYTMVHHMLVLRRDTVVADRKATTATR